jgi:SulP family sulfate permease
MAFAIASGLKPEQGLYTAIIAGVCVSAFGGTRYSIGGPAGAFIVVLYGIVEQHGMANLLVCTMMAGAMMTVMGMLRLGGIIKFVPKPVIIGFTNGIAVLILLSRLWKAPARMRWSRNSRIIRHLSTDQVSPCAHARSPRKP